ncbi:hypothetical protein ASF48_08165 [Rathayibacter sp. Leaf299]|uniref:hypothetical protein n=1 Tax=unclassified Rathayibacter TaxID=2609250 RepID=UPI000700AD63|nr:MULTISPECIES: hypothetical protein [unclassified Rathayibacter]KQQ20590.1 hypothetical protein ASF48_08165 [Rathayibacter sp. Leaf299]
MRPSEPTHEGPSHEPGARAVAVALTCLAVGPAALLTLAFLLLQLPPLDRDDHPDWRAPDATTTAPRLLLFLLPPLVTGALSRLVGGRDSLTGFWHYGSICLLVMVPFIGVLALSLVR